MQFRNPFKNIWGHWKDDATSTEKLLWTIIIVSTGMFFGGLISNFF